MKNGRSAIIRREPATKYPYLPNSFGRATLHEFDHAEVQPVLPGDPENCVSLVYRCTVTGELRRWGCEYTDEELRRMRAR